MLNLILNRFVRLPALAGLLLTTLFPNINAQQVDEQYLSGCAWLIKNDYRQAVESLSMAITRNNASDQLYIKRGSAYLNLKEFAEAVSDFTEANEINPQVADIWLARSYALSDQPSAAFEFLKRHLNSDFKLPEDSIKKDPAFDRMQNLPEWFTFWQQNWYNETDRAVADARFYSKRNQFDKALDILDNEINKDPGNAVLLSARGNILHKQGNFIAATGDFTVALDKIKNSMELYVGRADAYVKSERYRDAVADYNKAIRMDPGNFPLYVKRSKAYASMSAWESAIKDMQLYTRYFENDLEAVFMMGEYYYQSEDYMNALKCFNRNMKEDPNNANFYKARGKTYLKTGTYRYAISDLAMSLDLNPMDPEAWMYHGLAQIKAGNIQDGCSSLKRAQSFGFTEALKYIVEYCNP